MFNVILSPCSEGEYLSKGPFSCGIEGGRDGIHTGRGFDCTVLPPRGMLTREGCPIASCGALAKGYEAASVCGFTKSISSPDILCRCEYKRHILSVMNGSAYERVMMFLLSGIKTVE